MLLGTCICSSLPVGAVQFAIYNLSKMWCGQKGDFVRKCANGWGEWLTDCTDLKQVMQVMQKKMLKVKF